jgi:hypothetical protein
LAQEAKKMNTVLPIFFILALGCCSSLLMYRWLSNKWLSAFGGAGIATLFFVGGVYIMLWLMAPNELSPPLLAPILAIYFTALTSSGVAMGLTKRNGS